MVSVENEDGEMVDTIKISSNVEKISTPGKKQVWRLTNRVDGKTEGDYVALADEDPREETTLYLFHPQYTYINRTLKNFDARPVLQNIFEDGKLVYDMPTLAEISEYAKANRRSLWPEYKRELNPQFYPVDLSKECWDNKNAIIKKIRDYVNSIAPDEEE